MAKVAKVIAGLALLLKYDAESEADAQHDIIYAGSSKTLWNKISEEDRKLLDALGWHWDAESDSWAKFT
jgi:hypothetical protein